MDGLLIGFTLALLLAAFYWQLQKHHLKLKWYQWISTLGCVVLLGFTLMMIASFLAERTPKAALVMGTVFGGASLIWAILIVRLFIIKPLKSLDHE